MSRPALVIETEIRTLIFFRGSFVSEQMTAAWRESKVELTREWKKRHREAVKRVKRGMGSGGANVGEFAD